jgi:hypothetical protein
MSGFADAIDGFRTALPSSANCEQSAAVGGFSVFTAATAAATSWRKFLLPVFFRTAVWIMSHFKTAAPSKEQLYWMLDISFML